MGVKPDRIQVMLAYKKAPFSDSHCLFFSFFPFYFLSLHTKYIYTHIIMSFITTILTILIIIPIVPLFAYVIGLLVPASHIVSRTSTFKTSPKRLWQILTNVNQYPEWQPKVEKVILDESSTASGGGEETVFVEYSTRKRHTVIIHHERVPNQCLLRILEERPVPTAPAPSKIPTFSGSWTFELSTSQEIKDQEVTLKITEQGVIKKPLVRLTHLLLFGFHSRIDRFINDLQKKIDADNQEKLPITDNKEEEGEEVATTVEELAITEQEKQHLLAEEGDVEELEEEDGEDLFTLKQKQQAYYSTLLTNSVQQPHQEQNIEHNQNENGTSSAPAALKLSTIIGGNKATHGSQLVEANDTLMTESKIVDKEWDLMSEIYERTPPSVAAAKNDNGNDTSLNNQ
jgi:uncharacterized protein YndB with AHSA1/START domain